MSNPYFINPWQQEVWETLSVSADKKIEILPPRHMGESEIKRMNDQVKAAKEEARLPQFLRDEDRSSPESAYRAGLAEGFRRGVAAAADLVDETIGNRHFLAEAIRALRPEGDK